MGSRWCSKNSGRSSASTSRNCTRRRSSLIDVVQSGKFPAGRRQFETELDRCVFPIVRSLLERAVNFSATGRVFLRFGAGETLSGIGFALEDLVVTAQKIRAVFHALFPVGRRQRKFRHARDGRLITGDNRRPE